MSNARWVYGIKCKIVRGNLYLTEDQLSRKEMWCAADNHNNMCHICAKELIDSNFNKAVNNKMSNFNEIAPNFTYSQNHNF